MAFQSTYTGSHALLVAINDYGDARLRPLYSAEADALALAKVISDPPYEFSSHLLLGHDATKQAILNKLFELQQAVAPDDRVLIYFACHGYMRPDLQGNDIGYLAAVDTVPDNPFTALNLTNEIVGTRNFIGAKHIAFIFDTCFSTAALGVGTRSVEPSIEGYLLRGAHQVLAAGDKAVNDYQSMTKILIDALTQNVADDPSTGMLTFTSLGAYLRARITEITGSAQIPAFGPVVGSDNGEFIFRQRTVSIPTMLLNGLKNANPMTRYFALAEAENYIRDNPGAASGVLDILRRLATLDPDASVRSRAQGIIDSLGGRQESPPRPSSPYEDLLELRPNKRLDEQLLQLSIAVERADETGDPERTLRACLDLYAFVMDNRQHFGPSSAMHVGNAAVMAEKHSNIRLASALYELALQLEPGRCVTAFNYLDFIIDKEVTDLYPRAPELFDTVERNCEPEDRLEQRIMLRIRFAVLTEQEPSQEDWEALMAMVRNDPADRSLVTRALYMCDAIRSAENAKAIAVLHCDAGEGADHWYMPLRGVADILAKSTGATRKDDERVAMEMLRFFLANPTYQTSAEVQRQRRIMLSNLALLLDTQDYDEEAGRYWFEAYRLEPRPIKPYAMYLLRAERADLAEKVMRGEPFGDEVQEPPVVPGRHPMPEHWITDPAERWWEKYQ